MTTANISPKHAPLEAADPSISTRRSRRSRREAARGDVHARLAIAVEKRQKSYLWTPADAIIFVPRLLEKTYGDGRALYALSTINQRPAYWVIRACSTWSSQQFGEMTDDILTELEEQFGNGRCGYSGGNLFQSRRDRMRECDCEDCTSRYVAKWPSVDGEGGCSWGRMRWPEGFRTDGEGYVLAKSELP